MLGGRLLRVGLKSEEEGVNETVTIVNGRGTLRLEAALSVKDWRHWSDMVK